MYRKFQKVVLGLLAHVTPSIFFSRILRSEALVYSSYFFFRTAVLRKLFDIRFSYKHCNFSRVCLLVKMASKTVTRSIVVRANHYFRGGGDEEFSSSNKIFLIYARLRSYFFSSVTFLQTIFFRFSFPLVLTIIINLFKAIFSKNNQ